VFFLQEGIMREEMPEKNSNSSDEYLMESQDENIRLDIKTMFLIV
jgi:hypothetical protein